MSPWRALFKTGNQNLTVLIAAPIYRNKGPADRHKRPFQLLNLHFAGLLQSMQYFGAVPVPQEICLRFEKSSPWALY